MKREWKFYTSETESEVLEWLAKLHIVAYKDAGGIQAQYQEPARSVYVGREMVVVALPERNCVVAFSPEDFMRLYPSGTVEYDANR